MHHLGKFFIFCSGVHPSLLKRTPTDYGKYTGIGATIFFTGLMAFIAAGFAIYSIFQSYAAAVIFGLVWGLMIFNLDRYIVSSMKDRGRRWSNIMSAVPRLMLAVLIAVVISKPLELKIFSSEIRGETTKMEQELYKEQEDLLKKRFADEIEGKKNEMAALNSQLQSAEIRRNDLEAEALKEADGTGGSKIRNMGPIYKAKKAEADKAALETAELRAIVVPKLDSLQAGLAAIEKAQADEMEALQKTALTGFAAQLDALGRLTRKSNTIFWASIFITLLFIAIEITPIIAKLISMRSPYDYKLHTLEHRYEMANKKAVAIGDLQTQDAINYLQKTTNFQTDQLVAAENELFAEALKKKVAEEKEKSLSWTEILGRKRLYPE